MKNGQMAALLLLLVVGIVVRPHRPVIAQEPITVTKVAELLKGVYHVVIVGQVRSMLPPNPLCPNSTTILNGDFICEADYPGKVEGFPYLWWEDDEWIEENFRWGTDNDDAPEQDLTSQEKLLIALYPVQALQIKANAGSAKTTTINIFSNNGLNDKSDAFRHCYWLTLNTRSVGNNLALMFSNAHEQNVPTALEKEKEMDLFNNSIGIMIGIGNSTDLVSSCYSAVLLGTLRYLSPLLSRTNPNWPATHGIYSGTQLTPTNQ